jgi:hypothetical protein
MNHDDLLLVVAGLLLVIGAATSGRACTTSRDRHGRPVCESRLHRARRGGLVVAVSGWLIPRSLLDALSAGWRIRYVVAEAHPM